MVWVILPGASLPSHDDDELTVDFESDDGLVLTSEKPRYVSPNFVAVELVFPAQNFAEKAKNKILGFFNGGPSHYDCTFECSWQKDREVRISINKDYIKGDNFLYLFCTAEELGADTFCNGLSQLGFQCFPKLLALQICTRENNYEPIELIELLQSLEPVQNTFQLPPDWTLNCKPRDLANISTRLEKLEWRAQAEQVMNLIPQALLSEYPSTMSQVTEKRMERDVPFYYIKNCFVRAIVVDLVCSSEEQDRFADGCLCENYSAFFKEALDFAGNVVKIGRTLTYKSCEKASVLSMHGLAVLCVLDSSLCIPLENEASYNWKIQSQGDIDLACQILSELASRKLHKESFVRILHQRLVVSNRLEAIFKLDLKQVSSDNESIEEKVIDLKLNCISPEELMSELFQAVSESQLKENEYLLRYQKLVDIVIRDQRMPRDLLFNALFRQYIKPNSDVDISEAESLIQLINIGSVHDQIITCVKVTQWNILWPLPTKAQQNKGFLLLLSLGSQAEIQESPGYIQYACRLCSLYDKDKDRKIFRRDLATETFDLLRGKVDEIFKLLDLCKVLMESAQSRSFITLDSVAEMFKTAPYRCTFHEISKWCNDWANPAPLMSGPSSSAVHVCLYQTFADGPAKDLTKGACNFGHTLSNLKERSKLIGLLTTWVEKNLKLYLPETAIKIFLKEAQCKSSSSEYFPDCLGKLIFDEASLKAFHQIDGATPSSSSWFLKAAIEEAKLLKENLQKVLEDEPRHEECATLISAIPGKAIQRACRRALDVINGEVSCSMSDLPFARVVNVQEEKRALAALFSDSQDFENLQNAPQQLAKLSALLSTSPLKLLNMPAEMHSILEDLSKDKVPDGEISRKMQSWVRKYPSSNTELLYFGESSIQDLITSGEEILVCESDTFDASEWYKLDYVIKQREGIRALLELRKKEDIDEWRSSLESLRSAAIFQDNVSSKEANFLSEVAQHLDGFLSQKLEHAIQDVICLARLFARPDAPRVSLVSLEPLLSKMDSTPSSLLRKNIDNLSKASLELRVSVRPENLRQSGLCKAYSHPSGVCIKLFAAEKHYFNIAGHNFKLHTLDCVSLRDFIVQCFNQIQLMTDTDEVKRDTRTLRAFVERCERIRVLGKKVGRAMQLDATFTESNLKSWGAVSIRDNDVIVGFKRATDQQSPDIDEARDVLNLDQILSAKEEEHRNIIENACWILRAGPLYSRYNSINDSWRKELAKEALASVAEDSRSNAKKRLETLSPSASRLNHTPSGLQNIIHYFCSEEANSPLSKRSGSNKVYVGVIDASHVGKTLSSLVACALSLLKPISITTTFVIDHTYSNRAICSLITCISEAAKDVRSASYCLGSRAGLIIVGADNLSPELLENLFKACAKYYKAILNECVSAPVPALLLLLSASVTTDVTDFPKIEKNHYLIQDLDSMEPYAPENLVQLGIVSDLHYRACPSKLGSARIVVRKSMTVSEFCEEVRYALSRELRNYNVERPQLILDCIEDLEEILCVSLGGALVSLLLTRCIGQSGRDGVTYIIPKEILILVVLEESQISKFPLRCCRVEDTVDRGYLHVDQKAEEIAKRIEILSEKARDQKIDDSDVLRAMDFAGPIREKLFPFVYSEGTLKAIAAALRCIPPMPQSQSWRKPVIFSGDTGTGKTFLCLKLVQLLRLSPYWKIDDETYAVASFSAAYGHAQIQYLQDKIYKLTRTENRGAWSSFCILDEVTASPAQSSLEALLSKPFKQHDERSIEEYDRPATLFLATCNPDPERDDVFKLAKSLQAVSIPLDKPDPKSGVSFLLTKFQNVMPNEDPELAKHFFEAAKQAFETQEHVYGVLSFRDMSKSAEIAKLLYNSEFIDDLFTKSSSGENGLFWEAATKWKLTLLLTLYVVIGMRTVPRSSFFDAVKAHFPKAEDWFHLAQETICIAYELADTIFPTRALKDNLLALTVAIRARQPVLLLGNDGMSKSLSIKLIQRHMRGKFASSEFLRKHLPRIQTFALQFSPRTSASLVRNFGRALTELSSENKTVETKEKIVDNMRTVPCAVIEELSMAQPGPSGPLRALHGLLDNHQMREREPLDENSGSGSNKFVFLSTSNFIPERGQDIPIGRALANRMLVLVHEAQAVEELTAMTMKAATQNQPEIERLIEELSNQIPVRSLLAFARGCSFLLKNPTLTFDKPLMLARAAYLQCTTEKGSIDLWSKFGCSSQDTLDPVPLIDLLVCADSPSRPLLFFYDKLGDVESWLDLLSNQFYPRLRYCRAWIHDLVWVQPSPSLISILKKYSFIFIGDLACLSKVVSRSDPIFQDIEQALIKYEKMLLDHDTPILQSWERLQPETLSMLIEPFVNSLKMLNADLRDKLIAAFDRKKLKRIKDLASLSLAEFLQPRWREDMYMLTPEFAQKLLQPLKENNEDDHGRYVLDWLRTTHSFSEITENLETFDISASPEVIYSGVKDEASVSFDQEPLMQVKTAMQEGRTAVLINPDSYIDCLHALMNDIPDASFSTLQMRNSFETVSIERGARLVLFMDREKAEHLHSSVVSRVSIVNSGYPVKCCVSYDYTTVPGTAYEQLASSLVAAEKDHADDSYEWPDATSQELLQAVDFTSGFNRFHELKRISLVASSRALECSELVPESVTFTASNFDSSISLLCALRSHMENRNPGNIVLDLINLQKDAVLDILICLGFSGMHLGLDSSFARLREDRDLLELIRDFLWGHRRHIFIMVNPFVYTYCTPGPTLINDIQLLEVRDCNTDLTERNNSWPSLLVIANDLSLQCLKAPAKELICEFLRNSDIENNLAAETIFDLLWDEIFLSVFPLRSETLRVGTWKHICQNALKSKLSLRTLVLSYVRAWLFRSLHFLLQEIGSKNSIINSKELEGETDWNSDKKIASSILQSRFYSFLGHVHPIDEKQINEFSASWQSSQVSQLLFAQTSTRFPFTHSFYNAALAEGNYFESDFPSLQGTLHPDLALRLLESLLLFHGQTLGVFLGNIHIDKTVVVNLKTIKAVVRFFGIYLNDLLLFALVKQKHENQNQSETILNFCKDSSLNVSYQVLCEFKVSYEVSLFRRVLQNIEARKVPNLESSTEGYCKRVEAIKSLKTLFDMWLMVESSTKNQKVDNRGVRQSLKLAHQIISGERCRYDGELNIDTMVIFLEANQVNLQIKSIAEALAMIHRKKATPYHFARLMMLQSPLINLGARERATYILELVSCLESELLKSSDFREALRLVAHDVVNHDNALSLRLPLRASNSEMFCLPRLNQKNQKSQSKQNTKEASILFRVSFGVPAIRMIVKIFKAERRLPKGTTLALLLDEEEVATAPLRNFLIRSLVKEFGEEHLASKAMPLLQNTLKLTQHSHTGSVQMVSHNMEPWFKPYLAPPPDDIDKVFSLVPGFEGNGNEGLWSALGLTGEVVELIPNMSMCEAPALLWNALICPGGCLSQTLKETSGGFSLPAYSETLQSSILPGIMFSNIELVEQIAGVSSVNKCKCGEYYGIGECGGPKEISRCPNCHREIGGTGHKLVEDSHRIDFYDQPILGIPHDLEISLVPHHTERDLQPVEYRILWLLMLFPLINSQYCDNREARAKQMATAWGAFKNTVGLSTDIEASAALVTLMVGAAKFQDNPLSLADKNFMKPGNEASAGRFRGGLEREFSKRLRQICDEENIKETLVTFAESFMKRVSESERQHPLVRLRETIIRERERMEPEQTRREILPDVCILTEPHVTSDLRQFIWKTRAISVTSPMIVLAGFANEWDGETCQSLFQMMKQNLWAQEIPRVTNCLDVLLKGARLLQKCPVSTKYSAMQMVESVLDEKLRKSFVQAWEQCRLDRQFECQQVSDLGELQLLPAEDVLLVTGRTSRLHIMLGGLIDAHNKMVQWVRHQFPLEKTERVDVFGLETLTPYLIPWMLLRSRLEIANQLSPNNHTSLNKAVLNLLKDLKLCEFDLESSWPMAPAYVQTAIVRVQGIPQGTRKLPDDLKEIIVNLKTIEQRRELLEAAQREAARVDAGIRQGKHVTDERTLSYSSDDKPNSHTFLKVKVWQLENIQKYLLEEIQEKPHDILGPQFREKDNNTYPKLNSTVLHAMSVMCLEIASFAGSMDTPVKDLFEHAESFGEQSIEVQDGIRSCNLASKYLYYFLESHHSF